MDQKTANAVAAVSLALGLILILAGPAFHFIPTTTGIFLALVSWIGGGLVKSLWGKRKKEMEESKESEKIKESEETEE